MAMSKPSAAQTLALALREKGITNQRVLTAVETLPRHLFVDISLRDKAYYDQPLALSYGQTISQPFVVARMTELLLAAGPLKKVLEIGTGSGYQAAVLAQLAMEVYTIERIEALHAKANKIFRQLNIKNIFTRFADGNTGWPEQAPFDGIMVTAAVAAAPDALLTQLQDGGRMILPVGDRGLQQLQLIVRQGQHYRVEKLDPVIFVPFLSGIEK